MDKIDQYIQKKKQWNKELTLLRKWLNEMDLEETLKWGVPVYRVNDKNIIGIGAFQTYVGLWFFQGVFLKDQDSLLVNAQEGKTKGLRQLRFQGREEMNEKIIKEYVQEAIDNQKAGKEIKAEKRKIVVHELLKEALQKDSHLRDRFEKLSAGKQREYADYIVEAKRESTRRSRIEKIVPLIKSGVGLHDRYRKG